MSTDGFLKKYGLSIAPPYVQDRFVMALPSGPGRPGGSVDVRPIRCQEVWGASFPGEVDYEAGWRTYWDEAARQFANGSEYSPDRIAVEIQAFYADDAQWSKGAASHPEYSDAEVADYATGLVLEASGADVPAFGAIGILAPGSHPSVRPALTLVTSGPGGGLESTQIIATALNDEVAMSGVAMRSIRNDSQGVVKIVFMPEWYVDEGEACFGIDWSVWSRLFVARPAMEWGTACLVWCDEILRALLTVREKASLMIDRVHLDFYRAVSLSEVFAREGEADLSLDAATAGLSRAPVESMRAALSSRSDTTDAVEGDEGIDDELPDEEAIEEDLEEEEDDEWDEHRLDVHWETASDFGVWVRNADMPSADAIRSQPGLFGLSEYDELTDDDVEEAREAWIESTLYGDNDADAIPRFVIAKTERRNGEPCVALILRSGYSFTGIHTWLEGVFPSAADAVEHMRKGGRSSRD